MISKSLHSLSRAAAIENGTHIYIKFIHREYISYYLYIHTYILFCFILARVNHECERTAVPHCWAHEKPWWRLPAFPHQPQHRWHVHNRWHFSETICHRFLESNYMYAQYSCKCLCVLVSRWVWEILQWRGAHGSVGWTTRSELLKFCHRYTVLLPPVLFNNRFLFHVFSPQQLRALTQVLHLPIEVIQANSSTIKIGEEFDSEPITLVYVVYTLFCMLGV